MRNGNRPRRELRREAVRLALTSDRTRRGDSGGSGHRLGLVSRHKAQALRPPSDILMRVSLDHRIAINVIDELLAVKARQS